MSVLGWLILLLVVVLVLVLVFVVVRLKRRTGGVIAARRPKR